MTGRRITAFAAALLTFATIACQGDSGDARNDTARGDTAASTASAGAAASSAMVDPNTATREQLAGIQGMTPAAADSLVARRPFADMTKVDSVLAPQLDSTARRTVYATLWKPIDLNKASDAEILLIPGIGSRMLHEFKEYRPYTSIEQFRREIGKYVDNEEVARLEKYVSIR